jgi:hypothetical protein
VEGLEFENTPISEASRLIRAAFRCTDQWLETAMQPIHSKLCLILDDWR